MFINNKSEGFSLVELLISLIVISCITAAFTPLITKKFSSGVFGGSGIKTRCEEFGEHCNLCTNNYCLVCSGLTCADDEYKDSSKCSCEKCSDKFGIDCTKCNIDKCLSCPNGEYLDENNHCKPCTDKFKDCASCTMYRCNSCKNNYILTDPISSEPCDTFTCSSPDYIQIGNLCITKKNMGDGDSLIISSGVNVVNTGTTCNSSSTNKCCWKGNTAELCDNENGGGYSGCNRTVCDHYAADYICNNFHAGGYSWRLPTLSEMSNWPKDSIGKGTNGLQLCDYGEPGYFSARCYRSKQCLGGYLDWCHPNDVWSNITNSTDGDYYFLDSKNWFNANWPNNHAGSVRCVAQMPQSCAQRIGKGCSTCDGNTCLACSGGYVLKNGKCEPFTCSGDDFIQIDKYCVTKRNMGDSSTLTIPSNINIKQVNQTCTPSDTNLCCWQGKTAKNCDNANGGGYSGCNRTVCDWWAADNICKNFNAAGLNWRLPSTTEMANWPASSKNLGTKGLQLCDGYSGYLSAQCEDDFICLGAGFNRCGTDDVWSNEVNGASGAFAIYLTWGRWVKASTAKSSVFAVRCVTEMSQTCKSKFGSGCIACDNNECLACDANEGYTLENGKCKSTFCKGSDFMLIGNLCVTRKNMGDSTTLKIPSGVNVVNAGLTCNSSSTNFCCWKGNTAGTCDNGNGGGYSGCNRTVCDHYAADYICENFNEFGRKWRLATENEMFNWHDYSVNLGTKGLQLCDGGTNTSSSISAICQDSSFTTCLGSQNGKCYAYNLWSSNKSGTNNASEYYLISGIWYFADHLFTRAYSVRCVTEL